MIEKIQMWHAEACEVVWEILKKEYGVNPGQMPSCNEAATDAQLLAYFIARTDSCHYDIAHARVYGDRYRQTVFHEVCHSARERLGKPRDGHDALWKELLSKAGYPKAQATCPRASLRTIVSAMNRAQR